MASHPSAAGRIAEAFPTETKQKFADYQRRRPEFEEGRIPNGKRALIMRYVRSPSDAAATPAEVEAKEFAAAFKEGTDGKLHRVVDRATEKSVRVLAVDEVFDAVAGMHVAHRHARTKFLYKAIREKHEGVHAREVVWLVAACRVCKGKGQCSTAATAVTAAVNTAIATGIQLGGQRWAGDSLTAVAAPSSMPSSDDRRIRVMLVELRDFLAGSGTAADSTASEAC
jgi:hypothetical protein